MISAAWMFWIGIAALATGGLLAALFFSLQEMSRAALEERAAARDNATARRQIEKILHDVDGHITAVALPRIVCNMITAVASVVWVGALDKDPKPVVWDFVIGVAAASTLIWIFGLVVPHSVAGYAAEGTAYRWRWPCSKNVKQAAAPAPRVDAAAHHEPLPNVHHIGKLISGGLPDGDAGFDQLKAMGVRTIISVDGATPDVKRAEARGMRYVHIPITYAEVPEKQTLEIARAIRDLPGPVYIHCHHGKHRSPAAAAAAAVALGMATAEEGVAFMQQAGTAASYAGLYQCVAQASVASAAALSGASHEFPAVQKPHGLVAAMVEIDTAYRLLEKVRAAGWATPTDHPDLVPSAEAGRLADQLRFSGEETRSRGQDYAAKLSAAIERAAELEDGIVKGEERDQFESKWKLVAASCKDCHAAYRDKRP